MILSRMKALGKIVNGYLNSKFGKIAADNEVDIRYQESADGVFVQYTMTQFYNYNLIDMEVMNQEAAEERISYDPAIMAAVINKYAEKNKFPVSANDLEFLGYIKEKDGTIRIITEDELPSVADEGVLVNDDKLAEAIKEAKRRMKLYTKYGASFIPKPMSDMADKAIKDASKEVEEELGESLKKANHHQCECGKIIHKDKKYCRDCDAKKQLEEPHCCGGC